MKIEIWSDVMCPFCYIGKRKFEEALRKFDDNKLIEIEWKSYQLSPELKTNTSINIHQYLAEHKGISVQEAEGLNQYVTDLAKNVGLTFNLDKSVVANSKMAHCFSHFAKKYSKQNEIEEALFLAYFTEGKNIDDINVLLEIAKQNMLPIEETKHVLTSGIYENAVEEDIYEAYQIGVKGVPFFVFDRKYAISGAQEIEVFHQTIQKAMQEWKTKQGLDVIEGQSCGPDACE